MASPIYTPLPSERSFRLISVDEQAYGEVKLSLTTQDIDKPPEYAALSYTWGSAYVGDGYTADPICPVTCNGQLLLVTQNLFDFLHSFSMTGCCLWIDAVCINQADVDERNAQVAMMAQIYAKATATFVWLGKGDEFSTIAFDTIERLASPLYQLYMRQDKSFKFQQHGTEVFWELAGVEKWKEKEVQAMTMLLSREWFQRAWVVQEVAASAGIFIICGDSGTRWEEFIIVCRFLFVSGWNYELNALTIDGNIYVFPATFNPDVLNQLRAACEFGVLQLQDGERIDISTAINANENKEYFYKILEHLLMRTRPYKATRLQDKVFAPAALALHICSAAKPTDFSLIDYNKSVVEAYINATAGIICGTKKLSLLSFVEDNHWGMRTKGLPSWVPDYDVDLISPLIFALRSCDANRNWNTTCSPQVSGQTLLLSGVLFDSISSLGPPDSFPSAKDIKSNPSSWLDFCLGMNKEYPGGKPRTEAFLNTLVGGQQCKYDEMDTIGCLSTALLGLFAKSDEMKKIMHTGSSNADQALQWPSLDALEQSAIPTLAQVLDHRRRSEDGTLTTQEIKKQEACENWFVQEHFRIQTIKRLFMSEKGYIGLTSISVQPGDRIAFIPGSDVPFLIRESTKNNRQDEGNTSKEDLASSSKETTHTLVGEVYVNGLMHGELFKDNPDMEQQQIVLV